MQRLNKVNAAVNVKILSGLAQLAVISSQVDFKSVLQMCNKMGSEAISQDDQAIMTAVRFPFLPQSYKLIIDILSPGP